MRNIHSDEANKAKFEVIQIRYSYSQIINCNRDKEGGEEISTRQIPGLPFTDVDIGDDLDLGMTAVDLETQVVVDELLVRRPEPESERQRPHRQHRHRFTFPISLLL